MSCFRVFVWQYYWYVLIIQVKMKLVNLGHAQRWVLQIILEICFFTLLIAYWSLIIKMWVINNLSKELFFKWMKLVYYGSWNSIGMMVKKWIDSIGQTVAFCFMITCASMCETQASLYSLLNESATQTLRGSAFSWHACNAQVLISSSLNSCLGILLNLATSY